MTNYHTHTTFCDGADSPAEIARVAYSKGLAALGFSAHAMHECCSPVLPCHVRQPDAQASNGQSGGYSPALLDAIHAADDWHIADSAYNEYIAEVQRLHDEYAGRMEVLAGFEAEYIHGLCSPADPFYRQIGAQYIIGSVHYIVRDPLFFTVDGPTEEVRDGVENLFGGDARLAVCEYFALQREMLRAGGFEIWGHPDLFRKRNGILHLFDEHDAWYAAELHSTAEVARHSDVIAEINTGAIARGAMDDVYPSASFLAILHEAGVPVIINSDAHHAKDVDCAFDRAQEAARQAGYTEMIQLHATYDGMLSMNTVPLAYRKNVCYNSCNGNAI